jgi:DNA polymerase III epsilon subunit-like protein/uncharacterized protein (DUF3820 family)
MEELTLADLVVADLETTSWDPERAHITQMAAVSVDHHYARYLRQPDEILAAMGPDVIAVTGLRPSFLRDNGKDPAESLEGLAEFLGRFRVIGAHNWKYDRRVLARAGLDLAGAPFIDSYRLVQEFFDVGEWVPGGSLLPDMKLGTCYHGIVDPNMWMDEIVAHDAVHDAWMCYSLIAAMSDRFGLSMDDMIRISASAFVPRACPMGKHRGQKWSQVPSDYLRWMSDKRVWNREDGTSDEGLEVAVLQEMESRGLI